MGTGPDPDDRLLTIEDLAARWGVGEEVIRRHIKDGLPFVPLGRSDGKRPILRFRIEAIRAWEAARERVRDSGEAGVPAAGPPPGPAPVGWDGIDRTARRKKGGAKARTG